MTIKKQDSSSSSTKATTTISKKSVVANNKYDMCLKYIRSAIECLSDSTDIDKDDKETIANLGVVALEVSNKKKSCSK